MAHNPGMDRLEHYRIFVAVAEQGGFTRAAERLGLPKASVSLAVQQLEAALGTTLLHRTTRRVQLTQDGAAFLDRCRGLLDDADELQGMFRTEPRTLRGRLRVDMSNGLAQYVIAKLPEFLLRHPQLDIEIGSTDRRVDVAGEGYDVVLRAGAIVDDSLIARQLGSLRIVNCASPAYLRKHGTPKRIEDLRAHVLVHYVGTFGQRSPGWEYPAEGGGYANLPMPGALTVNSAPAYTAAALAGLGLIQSPALGMRSLIEAGRLVEVLKEFPAEPMPLTMLYPRRKHLPLRTRVFMDWIAETLAPLLDE